jgi:SRSO17 transposase
MRQLIDGTKPCRLFLLNAGLLLPGERKSVEPMAARLARTSAPSTSRCTIL